MNDILFKLSGEFNASRDKFDRMLREYYKLSKLKEDFLISIKNNIEIDDNFS